MMKASELHAAVAAKAGVSHKDVQSCLEAFTTVLSETLVAGDDLKVNNLGVFKVSTRAATTGRNPRTGESLTIPESKRVVFRGSKSVIDLLNSKAAAE